MIISGLLAYAADAIAIVSCISYFTLTAKGCRPVATAREQLATVDHPFGESGHEIPTLPALPSGWRPLRGPPLPIASLVANTDLDNWARSLAKNRANTLIYIIIFILMTDIDAHDLRLGIGQPADLGMAQFRWRRDNECIVPL